MEIVGRGKKHLPVAFLTSRLILESLLASFAKRHFKETDATRLCRLPFCPCTPPPFSSRKGKNKSSLLVVLPVNLEAESCAAEADISVEEMVTYWPMNRSVRVLGRSSDIVAARIGPYQWYLFRGKTAYFYFGSSSMQRLPSPERSRKATIRFETGSIFEPTKLSTGLVDLGYRRTERVEAPGGRQSSTSGGRHPVTTPATTRKQGNRQVHRSLAPREERAVIHVAFYLEAPSSILPSEEG